MTVFGHLLSMRSSLAVVPLSLSGSFLHRLTGLERELNLFRLQTVKEAAGGEIFDSCRPNGSKIVHQSADIGRVTLGFHLSLMARCVSYTE